MSQSILHQDDIRFYWRLVFLARAQLVAIQQRLSHDVGRWHIFKFKYRNLKIKHTILTVLSRKEARVGEQGLPDMMDDFRSIEADEDDWQDAKKDELDYIRLMVHGLRDVTEDEG